MNPTPTSWPDPPERMRQRLNNRLLADRARAVTLWILLVCAAAVFISQSAVAQVPQRDFGDAPEQSYRTLSPLGVAQRVLPTFHLGPSIDAETNGQPSADATGDGSDEDGVTFLGTLMPGQTNQVRVNLVSPNDSTGVPLRGRLDAWCDFNADRDWADPGEQIFKGEILVFGDNTLTFVIPAAAKPGPTFARFRLSQQGGLGPAGPSDEFGEVEDYRVTIGGQQENGFDFGDAPSDKGYPTRLAENGARHRVGGPFFLGKGVDTESDGQPNLDATGDDLVPAAGPDDEDGVVLISPLIPGQVVLLDVTASISGRLDTWLDLNANGSWADPSDRIFTALALTGGVNHISFSLSPDAKAGDTYARFRFTRGGVNTFIGEASDGEVEDYRVTIRQTEQLFDFGDAPELPLTPAGPQPFSYETTIVRKGAQHDVTPDFHLGARVDGEPDGQPNADATGDDKILGTQVDDEDGVVFLTPLTPGQVALIEVTASNKGRLDAWIDFNHANSWADATDRIFNGLDLNPGSNTLTFTVPGNALTGQTFARFRLSRDGKLPHLGPGGPGEVEDYAVQIEPGENCNLSCMGRDYWLSFPGNYAPDPANPVKLTLCAVGSPGTTVRVEIPGLVFSKTNTIPAGGVLQFDLPKEADLGDASDTIEKKGIHVTATEDIGLYGMSQVPFTSDGFLALATETLGNEYVVQAYGNVHSGIPELNGTQFSIAGCEPDTTVSITLPVVTAPHDADFAYTIKLQPGETYQLRNTLGAPNDLSGTRIKADKPVAVFGSHQCANVNSDDFFFCDYLVEQLVPVERWSTEFITQPLATRSKGDAIRILVNQNNTTVALNGAPLVTLDAGKFYELNLLTASQITANNPIHVTQYASSSDFDLVVNADPFMAQVPNTHQYSPQHTFCIPSGFGAHYVNIVAPAATVPSVRLDGVLVSSSLFATVPGTPYSAASAQITAVGTRHTVTAALPVGVIVYGWSKYESYGYPSCFTFGDSRPPELSCPGAITNRVGTLQPGSNIIVCEVPIPDLRNDVKVTDNCALASASIPTQQTPEPGTLVGPGTYEITVGAFDLHGNIGKCVTRFVVIDVGTSQDIRLVCPQDITMRCQSTNGAVVNYDAHALRGCTRLPLTCNPPPGSLFALGQTKVVCELPGVTPLRSCEFGVTVNCRQLNITFRPSDRLISVDSDSPSATLQFSESVVGPWKDVPETKFPYSLRILEERRRFFRFREP